MESNANVPLLHVKALILSLIVPEICENVVPNCTFPSDSMIPSTNTIVLMVHSDFNSDSIP